MLLADSEYRHELEADLEPFKGLLLGLFFIAVGMSVNLGLAVEVPGRLLALTAGLMLTKGLVLYAPGRRGPAAAAAGALAGPGDAGRGRVCLRAASRSPSTPAG